MKLNSENENLSPEQEQIGVVVEKLEEFLAGYLEQAEKLKITISSQNVLDLVDRAILVAQKVEQKLDYEKTVEGYFLDGMLEDFVTHQESIYEQVTSSEGELAYVPLSDAIWLQCLKMLRAKLLKIIKT